MFKLSRCFPKYINNFSIRHSLCTQILNDNPSSTVTSREEDKLHVYFGSSDFSKIVTTDTFIDKTLLIKTVFDATDKLIITAPRQFGKSTNLNMLKTFLEIKVDQNCEQLYDNSKLFLENDLKITKNNDFVQKNLGKHPVIFVDFKFVDGFYTFHEFLDGLKIALHQAYDQHCYLLKSTKLNDLEINKFQYYYSQYKHLDEFDISEGLLFLSRILYRHFDKPTIFLLCEYDTPLHCAVLNPNLNFNEVNHFINRILLNVLKSNQYINRALITGVSSILGLRMADQNNFEICPFLGDHEFVDYFGFTTEDVDQLSEKCQTNLNRQNGGYVSINNKKVYQIRSVLNSLHKKQVENRTVTSDYIENLVPIFKISSINKLINLLILGLPIKIKFIKHLTAEQIKQMQQLLLDPTETQLFFKNLYFHFLFELGYLCYSNTDLADDNVILANDEIRKEFESCLLNFYMNKYQINLKCMDDITSALSLPKINIFDFKQALGKLFSKLSFYESEYCSLLFMILKRKFPQLKGTIIMENGSFEIIIAKESTGVIINVRFNEHSLESLSDIIERKSYKYFEKCEQSPTKIEKTIFIGVAVTENKNLAVSYLMNDINMYNAIQL